MKGQTSKGLRITLLVYTIYSAFYGLIHVVSPESVGAKDPAIERVLGAAVLAFAFGAGAAWLERAWDRVKIVVLVQVAWMILYTITMVWGILAGGIGAVAWPAAIIGAVFAALLVLQPQFSRYTSICLQAEPPGGSLTARMTAPRLHALGPPPERPSQAQFPRAVGERQRHFQQAAHFRDGQLGQEGLGPPFFAVALQRTAANQA